MTAIACRTGRWTPLSVAAVVLGFIAWWPIGLAVLAYVFWGGSIDQLASDAGKWLRGVATPVRRSSGNAAFDAYRERTLKRLEEEQAEFAAYLQKLREARDQDEFDRFMAERSKAADAS
jgi:hypothetical protein